MLYPCSSNSWARLVVEPTRWHSSWPSWPANSMKHNKTRVTQGVTSHFTKHTSYAKKQYWTSSSVTSKSLQIPAQNRAISTKNLPYDCCKPGPTRLKLPKSGSVVGQLIPLSGHSMEWLVLHKHHQANKAVHQINHCALLNALVTCCSLNYWQENC